MDGKRLTRWLGKAALIGAVILACQSAAWAGEGTCLSCCWRCPPPYVHWAEGPPRLCFMCACGKPVCPPCTLEHYGYFGTCWHPWPFPPDLTYCHAGAGYTAATAPPTPAAMPFVAAAALPPPESMHTATAVGATFGQSAANAAHK
jgi:hypothetical protein